MTKMTTIVAVCGVLMTTSVLADHQRDYYIKINAEAWENYDQKRFSDSVRKFREVYQWAYAKTNEVLRYKSAGGLALYDVEWINGQPSITQQHYDITMKLIGVVEQVKLANIPSAELDDRGRQAMLEQAYEWRVQMSSMKGKIVAESDWKEQQKCASAGSSKVISKNPYEMTIPLGSFRGLATAVMAPCDILMAWPFAFENGDFMICGIVPTFGLLVSAGYMVWDVGLGVADFCTLGYVGNKWYDEETSPWWWERFSGKKKAAVFR